MNELHIDKTHWKRTKIGDLLYKTKYNDKLLITKKACQRKPFLFHLKFFTIPTLS